MNLLLWKITIDPYRLAKIQWILFRLFGTRVKKNPCGYTKSSSGYFCHQPFNLKYCDVINDGERHEVICKCCGHTRMSSNTYIDPYNDESWFEI